MGCKPEQSGMTLPEVLVTIAITGIVSTFGYRLFSDFAAFTWSQEVKAAAIDQRELAAQLIRKTLPNFVESVTGPLGAVAPSPSFWVCNSSRCRMNVTYLYTNINGAQDSIPLEPMRADCVSVENARLSANEISLKATDTALGSRCLRCEAGKLPQLTIRLYQYDATTGFPTVSGERKFPTTVGSLSKQGAIAMGVCVEASPYNEALGNGLAIGSGIRYDRWSVSLIPVVPLRTLRSSMTAADISSSLGFLPDKIPITKESRFAPGFRYTPMP